MLSHLYAVGTWVVAIFQNGLQNQVKFKKFKKLARSNVHLNIYGHKIAQIKGLWEAHLLDEVLGMSWQSGYHGNHVSVYFLPIFANFWKTAKLGIVYSTEWCNTVPIYSIGAFKVISYFVKVPQRVFIQGGTIRLGRYLIPLIKDFILCSILPHRFVPSYPTQAGRWHRFTQIWHGHNDPWHRYMEKNSYGELLI